MRDHRDVPIRGEDIRLGQLLKLADLVDAGSDVKPLLEQGRVKVNGEVESRRGRRVVKGDEVTLAVVSPEGPADELAVRVT
jgi:ribosome-associated protein